jgi:hypothetical protein
MRALTRPEASATPAPIMAPIIRPTAVKLMKFGMKELYMKRMPSAFKSPLRSVRTDSTLFVSGLMISAVTPAPNQLSTVDRTITMPIRIRKITTGWGTMLPTFSMPSRKRCITVFFCFSA